MWPTIFDFFFLTVKTTYEKHLIQFSSLSSKKKYFYGHLMDTNLKITNI